MTQAWRWLICRLFHGRGTYEERVLSERSGLRIETVTLRECGVCGRILYRNDLADQAQSDDRYGDSATQDEHDQQHVPHDP